MGSTFTDHDYGNHYARCHEFSDAYYETMEREYARMLARYLPANKQARILDVGCGTGFAVHALRKAGYVNVIGIDSSQGLVEIAQSKGLPVEWVPEQRTEAYLEAQSEPWDCILLLEVLEHLEYDHQIPFLQSIRKALKPDGTFLCLVPNGLCVAASYLRFNDWTHRCLFVVSSLTFVLECAGFGSISVVGELGRPSPVRQGPLNVLMPLARSALQFLVDGAWRVAVIAHLGVPLGVRHPISPTLLAIAKPR